MVTNGVVLVGVVTNGVVLINNDSGCGYEWCGIN